MYQVRHYFRLLQSQYWFRGTAHYYAQKFIPRDVCALIQAAETCNWSDIRYMTNVDDVVHCFINITYLLEICSIRFQHF